MAYSALSIEELRQAQEEFAGEQLALAGLRAEVDRLQAEIDSVEAEIRGKLSLSSCGDESNVGNVILTGERFDRSHAEVEEYLAE